MTRLAVLGSPIQHSRSPQLHLAAYGVLGLDWAYERIEQTEQTVVDFVRSRGPEWRGLSVTAPLKRAILPALTALDETAELSGAVNTVVLEAGRRRGLNTDVEGIVRAFARAGIERLGTVDVLGAGATAASTVVAMRRLGASRVVLRVRDAGRATTVAALGDRLGLEVAVAPLVPAREAPDAIVSTLPGGAEHGLVYDATVRREAAFFEVAYDPWPSPLAASWLEVGGTVVDGLDMLVEQAVEQVRLFAALESVPDAVVAAMRASVAR